MTNNAYGSTPRERVLSRLVIDPSGCLLWTGPLQPNGYVKANAEGVRYLLHRLMYEWFVEPIPDGMQIDHLCRTRHCANPAHMEVVTPRVNTLRGNTLQARNAAKTHCDRRHEFTEANTYVDRRGSRHCRKCRRARHAEWQARTP